MEQEIHEGSVKESVVHETTHFSVVSQRLYLNQSPDYRIKYKSSNKFVSEIFTKLQSAIKECDRLEQKLY